jgi:hypothetical protein
MQKKTFTTLFIFTIITSVSIAYGQWSAPTATPPNDNTPAPINVSANAQDKAGVLTLGGLGVFGSALITPAGGYTLPSNLNLGVNGNVGAKAYCDEKGQNCVSTLGGASISTSYSSGSGASSRAVAIRRSGYTLPVRSSIGDWPDAIVCEGVGGGAKNPMVLNLSHVSADGKVITYWEQDGVGVWIDTANGDIATAQRQHQNCGASKGDIDTMCKEGRCLYGSSGGASESQLIPGWPNKILCEGGDQKAVLYVDSVGGVGYPENRIRYSSFQDAGPHTSIHFKYSNGDYLTTIGKTDAFANAIDACIAKGNIKNQKGFN